MPKRSNHTSPGRLPWRWRTVYVAVAMMPCLCIVSLTYLHLKTSLADWRTAQTMQANGQLMIEASHLMRELQLERGLTAMLAGSKNPDLAKSLAQQQAHTDAEVVEDFLKALDLSVIDPEAREAVRRALTEITRIRTDAKGSGDWREAFTAYTRVIRKALDVSSACVQAKTEHGIGKVFGKITLNQSARESLGQIRGMIAATSSGNLPLLDSERKQIAGHYQRVIGFLDSPIRQLGHGANGEDFLQSEQWRQFDLLIQDALATGDSPGINSGFTRQQFDVATDIIDLVYHGELVELDALADRLDQLKAQDTAALKASAYWGTGGLLSVMIVLSMVWSSEMSRRRLIESKAIQDTLMRDFADQKFALDEHAIVSIADIHGNITYTNDKFCEISGYTHEELIGQNHRILKSDEHDRGFFRDLWKTISSGNVWHGEIKNTAKDGSHYWVDSTIVPFKDEHGKITQYVSVRTDITAMKESERRYKLVVNGSKDGLWDWDLLTDRVYYAPRWQQMLGLKEGEIGNSPDEWVSRIDPRDVGAFMQELDGHLSGSSESFEVELRMLHASGNTVWMLCRGAVVRDKDDRAVRVAGSLADITAIKDAQDKLRKAAEHDRLTDLPNRELFVTRLQQAIHSAEVDTDFKFAVLFFDFDRFKVINDSLGHNVGDALLIDIARQFEQVLRRGDMAARFGGDEFVVLLTKLDDYREARQAADRLLKTFARPHDLMGHSVTSTASIGLVTNAQGYGRAEDMVRDADAAMYQAKEAGKARVVVFDQAMHQQAVDRLQLEADLREALDRDEFHLLYQPIISLEAGELQGFEALLRWDHPTRGVVLPADFIPIAEDTGLIIPIGQWVLHEACRQLHQWNTSDRPELPISVNVNLSMRQVCHPGFIEMVRLAITDSGIDPQCLKLEVTESTIVDDRHNIIPMLHRVKELGIQLAMDDFGTGHSSLSNLHKLPIDVLKIDQSFIKSMSANRELAAVMHAIITVAQNLGMTTVAEGIETPEQLVMLQSLDCDFGQGYYFKKPLPADAATRYLLGFDDTAASA